VPPPRAVVPPARTTKPLSARPVGSFVPKLTKKALEKYGFSAATLLTDWAAIVGPDLAHFMAPERLKWKRGVAAYGEVEDGAEGRPGATLVLRVEGARALDVQMRSRQLIDRLNTYFGYRAVAEIRIVQGPVGPAQTAPSDGPAAWPAPPLGSPPAEVAAIADEGLRSALTRLGASVAAERTRGRAGS
jgi:hypothetical protein